MMPVDENDRRCASASPKGPRSPVVAIAGGLPRAAALCALLLACRAEDDPLATDVPMSGRGSPIFTELDITMRQLVKWRCAGAGVLAISYRGHRVYSRGFGKLRGSATPEEYRPGSADRCRDQWDPEAPITPPETPMRIGSISKGVVAAIVRPMVADRIAEQAPGSYLSELDVPLLDPTIELLPASIRRFFHHPDSCPEGLDCLPPPVANPGEVPPPEVPGFCDPTESADRRWPVITIGHLLTHRAGLARSNAQWPEVMPEHVSTIRGYNSRADLEDAHQRSREAFGAEAIETTRTLAARALGADPQTVYFIGHHDQRDKMPVDQQLKVLAGRCLIDWPGHAKAYSNSGHTLLGRVIDHLWSEAHGGDLHYSFAGRLGHPEEHENSALAAFVRDQLEIDGGVESRHAIYGHQWYAPRQGLADEPGEPEFRRFEGSTYTPRWAPSYHFYCVWSGDHCDTTYWDVETLRWRWDLSQGSVPHWAGMHSDNYASGGLVGEASAMLELGNRFQIGRGIASGLPRPAWNYGTSHSGSITGGYAFLGRHGGIKNTVSLPPLDRKGRITDNFKNLEEREIQPERGVAMYVAVSQQNDARCGSECEEAYSAIDDALRYTLTRIDWDDVRHLIDSRRRRVVGLSRPPDGSALAWYADGSVGLASADYFAPAETNIDTNIDASDLPRVADYQLPSTRIGDDVLGITLTADGTFVALFSDGRASLGEFVDYGGKLLPTLGPARPQRFDLPESTLPSSIVAFATEADGTFVTWLSDQTLLRGDLDNLGANGQSTYRLPPERAAEELAGATISADGQVHALFDDGSLALGNAEDLSTLAHYPQVVGVTSLADGTFVVSHANAHLRAVHLESDADEAEPQGLGMIALDLPPEPDSAMSPKADADSIVAIATDTTGITHVWLRNGQGRRGDLHLLDDEEQMLGLVDADLYREEFSWVGDDESIIDVAFAGDQLLVWRRDGTLAFADALDLRGDDNLRRTFAVAEGHSLAELVGVTIDSDGLAHARYRDGLWSSGSPENLGSYSD